MRSSAISRQLDALGRVVIPAQMRQSLNIGSRDFVDIYCEDDSIIIRKSGECCVFCGCEENILRFRGKCLCADCLCQLKK